MVSPPTQSGSVRSSSTAAKGCSPSSARPSDKVSRQLRCHRTRRVSESASATKRRSPGLSSMSKTANASSAMRFGPRRELRDRKPEVLDASYDPEELRQVDRLDDVAIGMQIVAFEDIGFGIRGGQDDDRDAAQVGIALHFTEHLAPIFA